MRSEEAETRHIVGRAHEHSAPRLGELAPFIALLRRASADGGHEAQRIHGAIGLQSPHFQPSGRPECTKRSFKLPLCRSDVQIRQDGRHAEWAQALGSESFPRRIAGIQFWGLGQGTRSTTRGTKQGNAARATFLDSSLQLEGCEIACQITVLGCVTEGICSTTVESISLRPQLCHSTPTSWRICRCTPRIRGRRGSSEILRVAQDQHCICAETEAGRSCCPEADVPTTWLCHRSAHRSLW
mmetsp:Transcript_147446/g.473705  ORF Transcript_147446/g.473705 Transcript_147446/m.473705 type:complete len:241 (-) Transcript_147446:27-749(-)